jgi:pilus assembly protein CpaF
MAAAQTPPDVVERVRRRLAGSGRPATPAGVASLVRDEVGGLLGDADLLRLVGRAQAELVGAGPLEPLLRDPEVTDVLVNAPDQVWVDRGRGLQRVPVRFADEAAVRRLAQRLATAAGRRLDDAQPCPGCTRCCRRLRRPAPAFRCGCSARPGSPSTSWSGPAR